MKYGAELDIATINATGLGITEWENTIRIIHKHRIELLALQETHIDSNSALDKGKCTFIISSSRIPKPTKGKGKGTHKGTTWESAGV